MVRRRIFIICSMLSLVTLALGAQYRVLPENFLDVGNKWVYQEQITETEGGQSYDYQGTKTWENIGTENVLGYATTAQRCTLVVPNTFTDVDVDYLCFLSGNLTAIKSTWESDCGTETEINTDPAEYCPIFVDTAYNNYHYGHGVYEGSSPGCGWTWTGYVDNYVTFNQIETVTVPAGTFECIVVDFYDEWHDDENGWWGYGTTTVWLHPDIGLVKEICYEWEWDGDQNQTSEEECTKELLSSNLLASESPDFNSDSKTDILWYRSSDNLYFASLMDGTTRGNLKYVGGPVIDPVGCGDFNGDGKTDILWRNSANLYFVSMMYGLTRGTLSYVGGPAIDPVGYGDFNGDGKTDILWYRSSDSLYFASLMDGPTRGSLKYVGGPAIDPVGYGDFNGDGKTDILWHRSDNLYFVSMMYGLTRGTLNYVGGPAIDPAGVGDFNGDGKIDILWHRSSDNLYFASLMDGPTRGSLKYVGGPAIDPAGFGDFNGDGKTDILWRNPANLYFVSMMYGLTRGTLNYVGGPAIDPVGVGDFNGDGKADILWHRSDDLYFASLMNGPTRGTLKYVGGPVIVPVFPLAGLLP